jgi:predicted ATPase/DNA-binding SARP family transcriptional activator
MVRFAILGPVELRAGEQCLPAGGPRQLALLAFLLLHSNRAVSGDALQRALWGERRPSTRKPVQMAIARLRRALEPLDLGQVLRTVSGGYLLSVAAGQLDADVFQAGLTSGRALLRAGDPAGASEALSAALGLWRGPALAEVAFEDFAASEIRRLEDLRLDAFESRIEADLALGRHGAVVGELEALSGVHPERERLCEHLMLALYRCGRQGEALEAYHRVSASLAAELGLDPGPALRSLQSAVLSHASWLTLDAAVASELGDRRTADSQNAPGARRQPAFALAPTLHLRPGEDLVGRAGEVERLDRLFEQAASGTRQLVMVCGEHGVGKTRLVKEFALRAHGAGAIVLYGRCDEETLLAHQPFVEALRHYVANCPPVLLAEQVQIISGELRRIVPEIAELVPELAEPLSGDLEGARYRLFEAVSALLSEAARSRPLVLVIDDLHCADAATLLLLKYVARDLRGSRLMVVGTHHEIDVESEHPLNGVLADLARDQVCERISLDCLEEDAVSELIDRRMADGVSPDLCRRVFEETGGNAFFVVEVLRDLAETGTGGEQHAGPAAAAARGQRLEVPERVKDVVGRRLTHLGPESSRVLAAASVLGHAFDFELLERLGDLGPDELVDILERAIRAQIIEETVGRAGGYAFSHALIREVRYGMLTAKRRALLHGRAAVAIEDAHRDDIEPHLAELAHHLAHAGSPDDLDRAIGYRARAGTRAVSLLAFEQAAAHYRDAIELLDRRAPERRVERCDLLISQGEAERMAGDAAYRRTLLRGARIAKELGDVERLSYAAIANTRGRQSSAQGIDHERVAVLRAALQALDESDSAIRASLLVQLAIELVCQHDWRQRTALSDAALAMARRVGHPPTLARVLIQRAAAQWNPRTLADRNATLLEAWQLADGAGHRLLAAHAAHLGSHAGLEAGDLARTELMLEALGKLVAQLGQPIIEWYHAIERAKLCVVVSSPKEAERLAVAAYEIGRRAGQPDATVWFLGHLFAARFLEGTLDAGEPDLQRLFEQPGSAPIVGPELTPSRSIPLMITAAMSAMLCEVGRIEDGRRHFEELMAQLEDLPLDFSTLAILVHAAIACAHLGDARRAEQLHALLEPYDGQFVSTGASWFGAVAHHLALLCTTIGRLDAADAHFAAAQRAYERLGADAWLSRCRLDWAVAVLAREGGPGHDPRRAQALLDQVLASARDLGMSAVEDRVAGLRRLAVSQQPSS